MIFFSILLLLISFVHINGQIISNFSGFFIPDIVKSASDFSAAFLISRDRFIASEHEFRTSKGIAGVTFAVTRKKCSNCASFATRDFFDFFVEHLSPYSNYIPYDNPEMIEIVSQKAENRASLYRKLASKNTFEGIKSSTNSLMNSTLGIIPFSTKAFSKRKDILSQIKIRQSFFELTFWSVYRYFPHIAVIISEEDTGALNELKLPIYHTVVVHNLTLSKYNKTESLPRQGVDNILQNMKENKQSFQNFKFVFFTEGDQVVHMRGLEHIFDFLIQSGNYFASIPHRLHTFLLSSEFPIEFQKPFDNKPYSYLKLSSATVSIEEKLFEPTGSCCDDGIYEIQKCNSTLWYQCPKWGIKDMFPWFRFGESGFPIPPVTAHRRSCQYYPTRTTCNIPDTCTVRTPARGSNDIIFKSQLCSPFDDIKILGPKAASNITSTTNNHFQDYQTTLTSINDDKKELKKALLEVSKIRKRINKSKQTLKQIQELL